MILIKKNVLFSAFQQKIIVRIILNLERSSHIFLLKNQMYKREPTSINRNGKKHVMVNINEIFFKKKRKKAKPNKMHPI